MADDVLAVQDLVQIGRPPLGRATDSRITSAYLKSRGLPGTAFDAASGDVDLVTEINAALANLHALVAYASPELAAQVQTATQEARDAAQVVSGLLGSSVDVVDADTGIRVTGLSLGAGSTLVVSSAAAIDPDTGILVTGVNIGGIA